MFLGYIGHYGCHGVKLFAIVGGQLQRKTPTRHLLHRGVNFLCHFYCIARCTRDEFEASIFKARAKAKAKPVVMETKAKATN